MWLYFFFNSVWFVMCIFFYVVYKYSILYVVDNVCSKGMVRLRV